MYSCVSQHNLQVEVHRSFLSDDKYHKYSRPSFTSIVSMCKGAVRVNDARSCGLAMC